MWSGTLRPWLLLVATALSCALFSLAEATEVTESNTAAASSASAPVSSLVSQGDEPQDDQESDWEYLRRFYDLSPPSSKRAYSYVSEFKRLPVYNFGLGKRSDPAGNRLYSFGLGKRRNKQYSFGLGKRPANGGLYSFGLGKRSMDYPEEDDSEQDEEENEDVDTDMDMDMEKRMKAYSFGLGKRYPQAPYSFGLGKRAPLYKFGLGKRGSGNKQYSFGLGKRYSNRQYSFGLGKREVSPSEAAAVAAEAAGHVIKKRSPNPEQLEWADAETSRSEEDHMSSAPSDFGRAGRRTYSFGLGKRLPLYSFGVGKRLSA